MLTIEALRRPLRDAQRFPLLSRAGLVLMVVAGALDVFVHLVAGEHAGHQSFGAEHATHLLGVVGMVFVLTGIVAHGARRQLRRTAAKPGGLDPNARR